MTNTTNKSAAQGNSLGAFLKDRRTQLDPATFGFQMTRRRTPGLRREEVALRANVSTTWYTWLEQGRGGAPSAGVLDRIAHALMLTDTEREHVFLLALGRPPEAHYHALEGVTPRLQRVLDALERTPAIVKTATWDVVAWNRAAAAVLVDYAKLAPEQRNILRLMFCEPRARSLHFDWEHMARAAVTAFRADVLRAGASREVEAMVTELCQRNPEFAAMWHGSDPRAQGDGTKRLRHPRVGTLGLEYSAFAVDGRPDLSLVVFGPATPADATRIETLIETDDRGGLESRRKTAVAAMPRTPRSRTGSKSAAGG